VSAGGADEKYHLYVDESGDHVFRKLDEEQHRFLCLLGCWFKGSDYLAAHSDLEALKQEFFPHNPDEPVVLHRADIVNARGAFWRLREHQVRERFDSALVAFLRAARFTVVAIVIDKAELRERYQERAAHPYHLALGFLLQRHCGYLNHVNRRGDVTAESRGGNEDRLLKDSYSFILTHGVWARTKAEEFQRALTSKEIKLKKKGANITGLQVADVLAHPVRQAILREKGRLTLPASFFVSHLVDLVEAKYNRHLYDGRIWGYGKVLFPE
jgi:hypothetical protein